MWFFSNGSCLLHFLLSNCAHFFVLFFVMTNSAADNASMGAHSKLWSIAPDCSLVHEQLIFVAHNCSPTKLKIDKKTLGSTYKMLVATLRIPHFPQNKIFPLLCQSTNQPRQTKTFSRRTVAAIFQKPIASEARPHPKTKGEDQDDNNNNGKAAAVNAWIMHRSDEETEGPWKDEFDRKNLKFLDGAMESFMRSNTTDAAKANRERWMTWTLRAHWLYPSE